MASGLDHARAFFEAADNGFLPVAVPGHMKKTKITTVQGTFLANSENDRARALACIMLARDAHQIGVNDVGAESAC